MHRRARRSSLASTPTRSIPGRGHRLALGATAVATVGLVGAFASSIGAQTVSDPIRSEVVSVDGTGIPQAVPADVVPAISDTGAVIVYHTASVGGVETAGTVDPGATIDSAGGVLDEGRRVWIRDRVGRVSRPVAEGHSVAPGVSGNGCMVAYTVLTSIATTPTSWYATLTVVDRCATPIEFPLPIGTILDTVALDTAQVARPSLSFDGSTVVWSTGREIRRYTRPVVRGSYVRSHTFDVVSGGSPDVVTGTQTDVSADGSTVVFVAGPGTSPFEPTTANIYGWTVATPQLGPELISATPSGEPGPADSSSPTISADGSFVVFESTSPELAVVGSSPVTGPFVTGVDRLARTGRVLVDDASRPTVSADGNHVVYQRGDAVRVLSLEDTSTIDHAIDELANARPTASVEISQHGRWLVFPAATDPVNAAPPAAPADASADALADAPATMSDASSAATAVWAVDLASSNADVLDTTTTTTSSTTTTSTTTTTSSTTTTTTTTPPTRPTTTTAPRTSTSPRPIAIVPRRPIVRTPFPIAAPSRTPSSPSGSSLDSAAASDETVSASSVTFNPTVIGVARRTESVILTNATSSAAEVVSASIDVPTVYTVVADTCSGASIAPRSTCAVEVEFAPVTEGQVSATLTFLLADGSTVVATLDGEGVPEPTLDVTPEVAGAGQAVTVFGAGFPPGSTVELTRAGSATPESILVDADGTFAHVIVVLPNTPAGPAPLSVSGQPDAFSDVTTQLVVSSRGFTSSDPALRGGFAGSLGP